MNLKSKIAVVTGASRGIGKGIALQLGVTGATVIGTATSNEGAEKISAYLEAAGLKGRGYTLNVNDKDQIADVIKTVTNEVGTISILVNNAGQVKDNLMLRMKDEEWEDILQTNLSGVFYMMRSCLRGMMKARWGRIINIGSVVGATGNPGSSNYATTKAGILGLSKSLAAEVASRGITVNVVAPGFIDTDMTQVLSEEQRQGLLSRVPLGRLGKVEDIAHAVAFLASEHASYITGETLHVNGGMYMS